MAIGWTSRRSTILPCCTCRLSAPAGAASIFSCWQLPTAATPLRISWMVDSSEGIYRAQHTFPVGQEARKTALPFDLATGQLLRLRIDPLSGGGRLNFAARSVGRSRFTRRAPFARGPYQSWRRTRVKNPGMAMTGRPLPAPAALHLHPSSTATADPQPRAPQGHQAVSSGTQALPRVCFVHIPKTAGNSIQSFFVRIYGELAFPGHVTEHYDACSESELAGYRYYGGHVERRGWSRLPFDTSIFTVVRHPVDRAVSLYRYWNELDCEANKYIIEGVRVARSRPIEDFVASDNPVVVQHLRGGLARQFLTNSTLTTHLHSVEGQPRAFDEAVKCLFSFSAVLTTERLATSFTKMLECLKIDGLDLPLARENVSSTVVEYDRNLLFSIMARQSPLDFQIYSVCQNLEQRLYAKETAVGARKSRQPRRQALVLDFGQGGNSSAYRRDGWSHQEQQFVWATGGMSSLAWPELPPCQRLMLHFDVVPFIAPPHRSVQRLTVKIGDATVAHVELGGPSAFWVQLPEIRNAAERHYSGTSRLGGSGRDRRKFRRSRAQHRLPKDLDRR